MVGIRKPGKHNENACFLKKIQVKLMCFKCLCHFVNEYLMFFNEHILFFNDSMKIHALLMFYIFRVIK